jgi:hypothetical protein
VTLGKSFNLLESDSSSVKWKECCEEYEITDVKHPANHAENIKYFILSKQ